MGPPPMGPPRPAPGRIRPGAGWYALPITLVAAALIGFLVVLLLVADEMDTADDEPTTGDPRTGVTVQLTEGAGYFIYVRESGTDPISCTVTVGETSGAVELTRKNAWSASPRDSYKYSASFTAPVSGEAKLTCRGADGVVTVTPDDTAFGYLGIAMLVGIGVSILAIIAFIVIMVRRGAAKRRAAPYGY